MSGLVPFEIKTCPQDCGKACGVDLSACATYQKIFLELQELCRENLHLLQYLHSLPIDELGIPEYYPKINRKLKGKKNPNLFYPIGNDVFIHVLANPKDIRDHYIPVEPSLADGQEGFLEELEDRTDLEAAREALSEPGAVPWDEVKARLGL